MHTFAAVVSFIALLLYADRTGWLVRHGSQTIWALVTRAGIALWMVSNTIAFLDLAASGGAFLWRHWLVLGSMLVVVIGHVGLGLRTRDRTSAT